MTRLVLLLCTGFLLKGIAGDEVVFDLGREVEVKGLEKQEAPVAVDYDRDGKFDIVSGNYAGNLILRKNIGTVSEPAFGFPVKIQSRGKDLKLVHW